MQYCSFLCGKNMFCIKADDLKTLMTFKVLLLPRRQKARNSIIPTLTVRSQTSYDIVTFVEVIRAEDKGKPSSLKAKQRQAHQRREEAALAHRTGARQANWTDFS